MNAAGIQPLAAARRFTVEEYHHMGDAGIFTEDDRVELIEGTIVEMTPIGSRHAACVDRLGQLFHNALGQQAIVRIQSPIQLGGRSEPQPDLSVLRPHPRFYADSHPVAEDVLLVVEVSDTSLEIDMTVKMPMYARAGIPEAWVVNLVDDTIEVCRQAAGGVYEMRERTSREGQVTSSILPGLKVAVSSVLL